MTAFGIRHHRALSIVLASGLLLGSVRGSQGDTTVRVSVDSAGIQSNSDSFNPLLSANGQVVAFESAATNLVAGDTNARQDIFVHHLKTGLTTRVSVDSAGTEGNGDSSTPVLSANGQVVAFQSAATNLVAGDTNGAVDVFVHNLKTGITTRVSVDSAGTEGNTHSFSPVLSANGQVVAFQSAATNLVAGDTNGAFDVFVHNLKTGVTTRVSEDSAGTEGNTHSFKPVLSANGQVVAFESLADNLVAGDTNGVADIFVHDLKTGVTTRVSVDSAGRQGNAKSFGPLLSANGQVIVFQSNATNLVAGDTNGGQDVFVHDLKTGTTARVSVDSAGTQGNGPSGFPALSANGRVVAFESFADNLVAGDTNGALDVFVHNLRTGITKRVSVDSAGRPSNLDSSMPVLSANGHVVAFLVVSRQLGAIADLFVHDLRTGATEQVSTDSAGTPGNDSSFGPLLSANGQVVAFESAATNLVVGDTNGVRDVFVHDRK